MKRKSFFIITFLIFTFITACSQISHKPADYSSLDKKGVYLLLPFENYTETPLAGLRAASIMHGVLTSKEYRVERYEIKKEKDFSQDEIRNLIKEAKTKGYQYAISGTVNEFRYKTGIDGEPAVSLTIIIYDLKNDRVIYTATGSRSGWAHESITTVTQKLINELIP